MKLSRLKIENFRSCKEVELSIGNMHALVGANNAGKSTILRALDFLFNPSTRQISEETFWNRDPSLRIRVEAVFSNLTDSEKAVLHAYLRPDGSFFMARHAALGAKDGEESGESDEKVTIRKCA